MSRIGKRIIIIPEGVTVTQEKNILKIKGKKGELSQIIHPEIVVVVQGNEIRTSLRNQAAGDKALWGLFGALIQNMVKGVTLGFVKTLEINGIGFKAAVKEKNLVLDIGYSHEVKYFIPQGIEIKVEENKIFVSGSDKQFVGETAARIRALKKPEPYKGKGIKYLDEIIRRKAGKVAKGASQ